jgi:DNA-binding NarL/FixJ family response regulator
VAHSSTRLSRVNGAVRPSLGMAEFAGFSFSSSEEVCDPITVMLIEEYEMVVDGLAAVMGHEPDISVVGGATTGAEALRLAFEIRPQVAVVGCRLRDVDGAETVRQLRRVAPDIGVVMLAARTDELTIADAVAAGCTAFIAKSGKVTELLSAVRAVAGGFAMFPSEVARTLPQAQRPSSFTSVLTAREVEILELLAAGEKTCSIADRLTLSQHTVRNHVRNLLTKMGAHSKLEAVVLAAGKGIIQMPGPRL